MSSNLINAAMRGGREERGSHGLLGYIHAISLLMYGVDNLGFQRGALFDKLRQSTVLCNAIFQVSSDI